MQMLKRIRHLFQPKALVLMYHRIAELKNDPWQLAVSPENFEQHLGILNKIGKLVSVEKLVSGLHNKALSNHSVCLTFDDGYSDNYLAAKPLLEKYQSPATFFIPTKYIGQEQPFWWDELENILLISRKLPEHLSLSIKGSMFCYDLGNDSTLTNNRLKEQQLWSWPAVPPTRRCELYLAIWEQLKPLPYDQIQSVLTEIKQWASFNGLPNRDCLPMTLKQLNELTSHPLINLGLHTVTHTALSCHNMNTQYEEISINRQYLQNICEKPVNIIAYPYGDYNDLTLLVADKLSLKAGFTTTEKIVNNLTDPFRIGRFQVRNWNGNDFEKWLFKWKNEARYL